MGLLWEFNDYIFAKDLKQCLAYDVIGSNFEKRKKKEASWFSMSELASFFSKMPDSKQLGLHWSYSCHAQTEGTWTSSGSAISLFPSCPKGSMFQKAFHQIKENSICIVLYRVRETTIVFIKPLLSLWLVLLLQPSLACPDKQCVALEAMKNTSTAVSQVHAKLRKLAWSYIF